MQEEKEVNPISLRLSLLIDQLNMSQDEFAHLINIAKSTLSSWLSGARNPSRRNLWRVIETTHVHPDWLIKGDGEQWLERAAPTKQELFEMQGMRRTLAYADPLWGTRQEETAPFSVGQPASLIEAAALRSTPEQKKLVEGMNATYTTLLDGFKARLADKDKRLEDKDKRLEDKDRLIDRLDKEIAALKEEIQNLKTRNIAGLP